MKKVIIVNEVDAGRFEDICNYTIADGYLMDSSSCGEDADGDPTWKAIFILPTPEEG